LDRQLPTGHLARRIRALVGQLGVSALAAPGQPPPAAAAPAGRPGWVGRSRRGRERQRRRREQARQVLRGRPAGHARKQSRQRKARRRPPEQEPTYRCPQGRLLRPERRCRQDRRGGEQVVAEQYRCAAEHCQGCPLAPRRARRPDKGRTVERVGGQELLGEAAQGVQAADGEHRCQKRGQAVEPRYADFRAHRGLDRSPRSGLRRGRGLIGLPVLAHNGLALLDARDAKKEMLKEANSLP